MRVVKAAQLAFMTVATALLGVVAWAAAQSLELVNPNVPPWLTTVVVIATGSFTVGFAAAWVGVITDHRSG